MVTARRKEMGGERDSTSGPWQGWTECFQLFLRHYFGYPNTFKKKLAPEIKEQQISESNV